MTSTAVASRNVTWFKELLAEHWGVWGLPGAADRLRVLQVAGGNWHVGQRRVTWLAFGGGRRQPLVACKCSAQAHAQPLANEHRALVRLFALEGKLGFAVPEPLLFDEGPPGTALVQRCLAGAPLHVGGRGHCGDSPAGAVGEAIALAGRFCEAMLADSGEQTLMAAHEHPRVRLLCERLTDLHACEAAGELGDLSPDDVTRAVAGVQLPHPWHFHGDLTSDHLLVGASAWGVIDWEGYATDGLPLADFVQYCLTLSQYFEAVDVDVIGAALLGATTPTKDDAMGVVRQTAEALQGAPAADRAEARLRIALTMLDAIVTAKWVAMKSGAREPAWASLSAQVMGVLRQSSVDHEPPLPMVSIVVPLRNEAPYIDECIASYLSQDYPSNRLEVVVADGMSSDGSAERVAEFARRDPRVRVVTNPRRVRAAGVNEGIAAAQGDIIILMDFHVVYPKDYVKTCVELLESDVADNVGGVIDTKSGAPTLVAKGIAAMLKSPFGVGGSRFRTSQRAGVVDTVPFGAFYRTLIDRVGGFNERLVRTEDNEFNSRITASGGRVYMTPRIWSTYYARPTVACLCRQAFGSGKSHIATLVENAGGFTWRHFIPFCFVLSLLIGVLGWLWSPFGWAAGASLTAYAMAAVVASMGVARREGASLFPLMPPLFLAYHVTYGVGTLYGLACLPRFLSAKRSATRVDGAPHR